METVEVHSKAFVIKWISVPDSGSIRWQIRPNKKSINFGIFRRPPGASDSVISLSISDDNSSAGRTRSSSNVTVRSTGPFASNTVQDTASTGTLDERLRNSGLTPVYWHGKCHANNILKGSYQVPKHAGGMFAFVFDNTFSKTLSKTVQFAHSVASAESAYIEGMTATTTMAAPRRRRSNVHHNSVRGHRASVVPPTPPIPPTLVHTQSDDQISHSNISQTASSTSLTLIPQTGVDDRFHSGVLLKKRRKKLQGYAKRYFTLDHESGILSYYHDVSSSLLRGSIPLMMSAVSVKPTTREIFIDSGAEIFNLRASTQEDFESWKNALEQARTLALAKTSNTSGATDSGNPSSPKQLLSPSSSLGVNLTDREWTRMEEIGDKLNAVLKLSHNLAGTSSPGTAQSESGDGYFALDAMVEQVASTSISIAPGSLATSTASSSKKFWKKRPSAKDSPVLPSTNSTPGGNDAAVQSSSEKNVAAIEVLQNLLSTINHDFTSILNAPRRRSFTGFRMPNMSGRRKSIDVTSVYSESEFFDAEEGPAILVLADNDEVVDDIVVVSDEEEGEDGARSSSSLRRSSSSSSSTNILLSPLSPTTSSTDGAERDLFPLPIETRIQRRNTVPPNSVLPPSLIQFVRKNVGKDLSTIAMPVTANEPLSVLQRYAEPLEYSRLLDTAVEACIDSGEQMMYIAAFAISNLSNMRCNSRALRKPFNPLMNETFEMVREDLNFRFLAEKISHRPPIFATFAEAPKWTYSYCPQPAQKFWGKSAELISDGPITISLVTRDRKTEAERTVTYSYKMPTTYLRNMLAGEKYVEPSGQMHIAASTGHKAVVEFKSRSMFSGQKSDEVLVNIMGPQNTLIPEAAVGGKWTTELIRASDEKKLWSVGKLLPDPKLRYGMPEFCATLNDITDIEKGKIAPTDSRLRPDQRCLENARIDEAERLKKQLEEAQRERRKLGKIPSEGVSSLWFTKVENGVWVPIQGANGYWERRRLGKWDMCPELW
ncbi:Oxysterol-binding protein-domain-containing protein [Kockiozyma suomiensis]|uniref:Oxysterol-binding protein-domain-containing protein n=1 Tax=Kockiozyma suomiensis TaxID=1337062 RepID=UPI0033438C75